MHIAIAVHSGIETMVNMHSLLYSIASYIIYITLYCIHTIEVKMITALTVYVIAVLVITSGKLTAY